ncbi:MAG: hypothetical protein IJO87_05605 [Eggerthellaceae bacterium]|nr:hypothetical protein [Eggerthellaceae bacterium]
MLVDGDGDADLLLGEPALARLAITLGEVGVVHVSLVDPDTALEHDAVLIVVDGGEHAVAPLPGGLMTYPAYLRGRVEWYVEAHEPDELDPGGEVFLAADYSLAKATALPRWFTPPLSLMSTGCAS